MLLKFFSNAHTVAYLRGLADEFGESTNSIRLELNRLSDAGYLTSEGKGRTIEYKVNMKHPLYGDIRSIVHKYLGFDKIIDTVLSRLGHLSYAFVVGDYAIGKDSGVIRLLLVGKIDKVYLKNCIGKAEKLIHRKIQAEIMSWEQYENLKEGFEPREMLLIWENE